MHDTSAVVEQPADVALTDVPCPMCEYDLRGLPEPRCPECGYAFDWADLIDPTRRKHKYLFEHHPQHNIWSFCRTAMGGLLPWRFWRSLRPEQPSNVRRLIVYWLITAWGVLVLPLGLFTAVCVAQQRDSASMRPRLAAAMQRPRDAQWAKDHFDSVAGYLDEYAPLFPSRAFFSKVWRQRLPTGSVAIAIAAFTTFLALPWVTALSLMIFQATMRRARVRGAHVLRCCLYSFDGGWWFGLLMTAGVAGFVSDVLRQAMFPRFIPYLPAIVRYATIALLLFSITKLLLAYQLYMRFPRAIATVVLALAVTLLALIVVLVNAPGLVYSVEMAWQWW
jgi:hypothetical protein